MSEVQENGAAPETNDARFPDDNRTQIERAKIQLVYLLIFSVFMLFGGFVSAYIVSMGDSFWLKVPFPSAFTISTVVIALSSVLLVVAIRILKKRNQKAYNLAILGVFFLGLAFIYFQFKGYGQLIDNGVYAANNHIIVTDGRYGDYFEIKRGDDYVEVSGNEYLINGKKMTDSEMKNLQEFVQPFLKFDIKEPFKVEDHGEKYTILFESRPLMVKDSQFYVNDSTPLPLLDRERLFFLAQNINAVSYTHLTLPTIA